MNLSLDKLVACFQNRNKIFSHTEVLAYARQPVTISAIDPLWPFTQLKKNYGRNKEFWIFRHYTNPDFFKPKRTDYGWSNRMIEVACAPYHVHYVSNSDWFWKQKRACQIASWLYCLPGIKRVFVCGSVILEISTPEPDSDIDFAIQTHRHQVLLARFWAKLTLKLLNLDTHNLKNSFKQFLARWGWLDAKTVDAAILRDKKRHQNRNMDCGLFFVTEQQVLDYFGLQEKQLSILGKALVIDKYTPATLLELTSELTSINTLGYYYQPNRAMLCLRLCTKIVLYILSLPLCPLIGLQIVWYKLKTTGHEDHCLTWHFSSFFPRRF